jgi:type IV pilus assembly protein PilB
MDLDPDTLHEAATESPESPSLFADLNLGQTGPGLSTAEVVEDLAAAPREETTSPVLNLVNRILAEAINSGASDIHVEPQPDGMHVRFRQDGVLRTVDNLPKTLVPAVTSRFKIMADLDIAERRLPQDGRIRRRFREELVDFRVSTLPGRYGEKVVLRILDSNATQLGLDTLITDLTARSNVRDMGGKPFGMLLVTGPTGKRGTTSPRPCGHSCDRIQTCSWWERPGTWKRPARPSRQP